MAGCQNTTVAHTGRDILRSRSHPELGQRDLVGVVEVDGVVPGRGEDLGGHPPQVEQRLMAVRAPAEVVLGAGVQTLATRGVDQGSHLMAYPDGGASDAKWSRRTAHSPANGCTTRASGEEEGDQRACDGFSDTSTLEWRVGSGSLVEPIDQFHVGVGDQRTEQPGNEMGPSRPGRRLC